MANTINPNLYLSSFQAEKAQENNGNMLGKDDFLKILMVQLQNQDPTAPMQDKEFISQMATFTSLEQLTNMNKSLASLMQMQGSQLIGKQVTYTNDNNEEITAEVIAVSFKNGQVNYQLDNREVISNEEIQVVSK